MGQPLYKVSRKCHFTFSFDSVLCKWEWIFFTRNYITWHPPHSGISDPQAVTARSAFVHKFEFCSCIRSTDMKGVRNDDPDPWPLNPIVLLLSSSYSHQGRVFVLSCQRIHTHIHIMINWSLYPRDHASVLRRRRGMDDKHLHRCTKSKYANHWT